MKIATLAVLAFCADSKYMKFFQFVVTHPKQKSEKICLILPDWNYDWLRAHLNVNLKLFFCHFRAQNYEFTPKRTN